MFIVSRSDEISDDRSEQTGLAVNRPPTRSGQGDDRDTDGRVVAPE
jgi:hypothetical protein